MKRLLMIAASVLAFAGAAHGAEMPKELHGVWCLDRTTGYYIPSEECTVRAGFGISASRVPHPRRRRMHSAQGEANRQARLAHQGSMRGRQCKAADR